MIDKLKFLVRGTVPVKTIIQECPHTDLLERVARGSMKHLETLTEGERKEYVNKASELFTSEVLNTEIDALIETQAYAMAQTYSGDLQHEFGKGTINGFELVRDHLRTLHAEHLENTKPKEMFDKFGLISEQ